MDYRGNKHIVVVEAYEGFIEFLSDEFDDWKSSQGLGLPLDEIAEILDCRITVFSWDDWHRYELSYGSPFTWVTKPVTRPVSPPAFRERESAFNSPRLRRVPIRAWDPVFGRPFSETGLSRNSHGLIANNDLMFFVSFCLKEHLNVFQRKDPFQAVILPMWGGLGYLSQLTRATGAKPSLDVPFVVVATGTSAERYASNQEGCWTHESTIRRQMEDVSLALADAVIVFGPLGASIAAKGRLIDSLPPIIAPRRIDDAVLDKILEVAERKSEPTAHAAFFLNEPQQPASGVLAALEAAALLGKMGISLRHPVISSGPPMIFAPMNPRDFQNYWSSRGFVREIVERHQWRWERNIPTFDGVLPVRLFPSLFEHLPNVWTELARGSLVILSPAAAEGLAPGQTLPKEIMLNEPSSQKIAEAIRFLASCDAPKLEVIRRDLCTSVVAAHRNGKQQDRLAQITLFLDRIFQIPPKPQDLSRVAILFLDRCRSLSEFSSVRQVSTAVTQDSKMMRNLSVVVTCYEMGSLILEAVKSVWSSERMPDEVLLVDDGSCDEKTLQSIEALKQIAVSQYLPLRVIHQSNTGLSGARNAGLAAASCDFISFLDGDDVIDQRFYGLALRLLKKYSGLGGVAAWALCFNEKGITGFWNAPQPELPASFIENRVIVPCLMETKFLRDLGGYDTSLWYNYEDWELSIRILVSGRPIIVIPAYLMKYRERAESLYRSMTEVQNLVMRERFFSLHRETASTFGVEIAMQLEDRLMRCVSSKEASRIRCSTRRFPMRYFLSRIKEQDARFSIARALRFVRRKIKFRKTDPVEITRMHTL